MAIDTLRSVAHLQRELGDELFSALISSDNTATVKQFLLGLQPLLTPIGTIKVRPGLKLVASEFFQVNTKKNALVKISYVGDNFKAWFLSPSVREEEAIPGAGPYRTPGVPNNKVVETSLHYYTLNRRSVDGPIIAELGGETKAETTLAELVVCLQKQANGELGALLTNGYANIFYIRDASGVLRAVHVYWRSVGWLVDADSVGDPNEWNAGYRVFSRDS